MSKKGDEPLDQLLRAAESATGSMREAARELEDIARALPEKSNKARRQQLEWTAKRLTAAADLLTLEARVGNPHTAHVVAKVGKVILVAGAALFGSLATGAGEGIGEQWLQRYLSKQQQAIGCLEEVEGSALVAIRAAEDAAEQRNRPEREILEVSARSNPNSAAGAIAGNIRLNGTVMLEAKGVGAMNQAVKAIAIARGYLAPDGFDLVFVPSFGEVAEGDDVTTIIRLIVEDRVRESSGQRHGRLP